MRTRWPLLLLALLGLLTAHAAIASPEQCGTSAKPAVSCADIFRTRPTAPSGMYIVQDQTARGAALGRSTELVYCDMEAGGLQMMAKLSRGYTFGGSLNWALTSDELHSDTEGNIAVPRRADGNYYSRQRGCWNDGTCIVDYVVVKWYKDAEVKAYMMFDTTDVALADVFSINNLLASSWTDLYPGATVGGLNFNGADGDLFKAESAATDSGNYCNTATIWATAVYDDTCVASVTSAPQFAYSTAKTASLLTGSNIDFADTVVVFAHVMPDMPSAVSCGSEGLQMRAFAGAGFLSSTTVEDASGQSVAITSHGTFTEVEADWGASDHVASFPDVNSYVSAATHVTATQFSVSFLFKSMGSPHGATLAAQCDSDSSIACAWEVQYIRWPAPGVRARITYANMPKRLSSDWDVTAPAPAGKWHHVVLSWKSSTGIIDLHVDGVRTMAYLGKGFSVSSASTQSIALGNSFVGQMFDARVFSAVVTETTGASIWDAYSYLLSVQTTWLSWRLGVNTGAVAYDLALSDNHASLQGVTHKGSEILFTQSGAGRIVSARPMFTSPSGDTSISMWIYLEPGVLFDDMFCMASITFAADANSVYPQLNLCMYNRQLAVLTGSAMYLAALPAGPVILTTGVWHHVAVAYTWGSASSIRVFQDGVHLTQLTATTALHLTYRDGGAWLFGRLVVGAGPFNVQAGGWVGSIGAVQVFTTLMDVHDAGMAYDQGLLTRWTPTLLFTPLDRTATAMAPRVLDQSSLQATVGVISPSTGGPSVQHGFLKFANNHAIIGQSPTSLRPDGAFSLMGWLYYDAASFPNDNVVALLITAADQATVLRNGQVAVVITNGELTVNFGESTLLTGVTLSTRKWYHVAVTKSPGNKQDYTKLYLNGNPVSFQLGGDLADLSLGSTTYLYAGLPSTVLTAWTGFIGYIDDVRLHRIQLSADQVNAYVMASNAQHGREFAFHGSGQGDFLEATGVTLTAAGATLDMMVLLPRPAQEQQTLLDVHFADGTWMSLITEELTGTMVYSVNSTAGLQTVRSTYSFPRLSWTRVTLSHAADGTVKMYWNKFLQGSGTAHALPTSVAATLRIGHRIFYDKFELHSLVGSVSQFNLYTGAQTIAALDDGSAASAAIIKFAFQPAATTPDPFESFNEDSRTVDNTVAGKPDGTLYCQGVCLAKAWSSVPICGDGLRRNGEECDDGNLVEGDGCSASCFVESGWTCQSATPWEADVCVTGSVQYADDLNAPVPASAQPPVWMHVAHNDGTDAYSVSTLVNGRDGPDQGQSFMHPCHDYDYMAGSWIMKLVMGKVVDYYRPTKGHTLCDILTGTQHYAISSTYDGSYMEPSYPSSSSYFGGTADNWPGTIDSTDTRRTTGQWGNDGGLAGGCCHSSSPLYGGSLDDAAWRQPYDMYVQHVQPSWQRVATVSSTDVVNAESYVTGTSVVQPCGNYGWMADKFIVRVTMGSVVDYYRPNNATDLCDMLTSSEKHLWSASLDGAFVAPEYTTGSGLGGSTGGWPSSDDGRQALSRWGTSFSDHGGCCHSHSLLADGTVENSGDWGQAFTLDVMSSHLLLGCDNQFDGGGWTLVRHAPVGNQWFLANDNALGTTAYGVVDQDPASIAAYSYKYSDLDPTEVLITNDDYTRWMVVDYSALSGVTEVAFENDTIDANNNTIYGLPIPGTLAVKRSYLNHQPHTVNWFNRGANYSYDPSLSPEGVTDPSNDTVLYQEDGKSANFTSDLAKGVNVWVRSSKTCGLSWTPAHMPPGAKFELAVGAARLDGYGMKLGFTHATHMAETSVVVSRYLTGTVSNDTTLRLMLAVQSSSVSTVSSPLVVTVRDSYASGSCGQSSCDGRFYRICFDVSGSTATALKCDTTVTSDSPQWQQLSWRVGAALWSKYAALPSSISVFLMSVATTATVETWIDSLAIFESVAPTTPHCYDIKLTSSASAASAVIDGVTLTTPTATAGQVLLVTQYVDGTPTASVVSATDASAWRTALAFLPDHTYVAGALVPSSSELSLSNTVRDYLKTIGVLAPAKLSANARWAFAGHKGAPFPTAASNMMRSSENTDATVGDVFKCAQFVTVGPWPTNRVGLSTELPRRDELSSTSTHIDVYHTEPHVDTHVSGTTLSFPSGVAGLANATIIAHAVGMTKYFHYGPTLFGAGNGVGSFLELPHGLTGPLHSLNMRVKIRVSVGDHAGAIFGTMGAAVLDGTATSRLGGAIAALTPTHVRIWAPSAENASLAESSSARIVNVDGGVGSGSSSISAREAFTEVEITPELPADFDSGWFDMSSNAGADSFKSVAHGLASLPTRVKVLVKAVDGPNNGAVFEAFGMAQNEDVSAVPYGGLVYAYSATDVRLWAPTSMPTRANATGYLVHIGYGWGGDRNTQASHNAKVRVMAWLDVGEPDFYSPWSLITNSGGSAYFHDLHGFGDVPARVSVRFRSTNATGVHAGYVFDAMPTWQLGMASRSLGYSTPGPSAGVVYAYGNQTIKVWAASGLSQVIRTGRGWGYGMYRSEESKAEVEVRAWRSNVGANDVAGLNIQTRKVNVAPVVRDTVKVVADLTQERAEIMRVQATDADSPFLNFKMVYGNPNIFSVDQVSGAVFLLDRRAFNATHNSYMVSVAVSDGVFQDTVSVTLKRNITVPLVPSFMTLRKDVVPYGRIQVNLTFGEDMPKMLATVTGTFAWTNETSTSVMATVDQAHYLMTFDLPTWRTDSAPILPPANAIPYPVARITGTLPAHSGGVRPENAQSIMNIYARQTPFVTSATTFPQCPTTDRSHNRHVWSSLYPVFHDMSSPTLCCHSCNGTNHNVCKGWMMIDGYCYHATQSATISRADSRFKERYSNFYLGPINEWNCDKTRLTAPMTHIGDCNPLLGNECNLVCDTPNPQLVAGRPFVCELDGVGGTQWVEGLAPVCTHNCSRPALPQGFSLGTCTHGYLENSTCTGQCSAGWGLISGSGDTTCSLVGWSPISALCGRDCGPMPAPSHGVANPCSSTLAGSTCTSSCNAGYSASSGALTRQCLDDGTWSDTPAVCVHDCGAPPALSHGKFAHSTTIPGSQAEAECDTGFLLSGDVTTITCNDGASAATWSSHSAVCIGTCGVPSIANGRGACTNYLEGAHCPVECNPGFQSSGATELICNGGGWDGAPVCKGACGDPPTYGDVNINCPDANKFAGGVCTFSCMPGSTLIAGELSATCTADGWSGAPPVCVRSCGNGKLDVGEECDDGNSINTDGCTNQCNLIGETYSLTGVLALMGVQATVAARTADDIFVAHAASQAINPETSTMPLQRPVLHSVRMQAITAVSDASRDTGVGLLVKPHQLEDLVVDNNFMFLNVSFDTVEYQWEDLANLVLATLPDPLAPLLLDSNNCETSTTPSLNPFLTGDITGDGKNDVVQVLTLNGLTCFRTWPSEKSVQDHSVSCGTVGSSGPNPYWAIGKASTGASRGSAYRQTHTAAGKLCTAVFTFDSSGRVTASSESCVTRSGTTATWLSGDIAGNGVISFVQVMTAAAGATTQCYYKYLNAATPTSGDSQTCVTVTGAVAWFLAKVAGTQLDLVAIAPSSNGHQGCINYWSGSSSFATLTQHCTGYDPAADKWFVADIDADSHADLIQVLPTSGASVGCIQWFTYATSHATRGGKVCTSNESPYWYVGDVNNDNKADVVQRYEKVVDDMQTCWTVMDAASAFSQTTVCDTTYARTDAFVFADLQNDGRTDVTLAYQQDNSVCLYHFRSTSGGWVPVPQCRDATSMKSWVNNIQQPVSQLYGDINGDGKSDSIRMWVNSGGALCWQVWEGAVSWLADGVVCSGVTVPTSISVDVVYMIGNIVDSSAAQSVLMMTVDPTSHNLCIYVMNGMTGATQTSKCYASHPEGFQTVSISATATKQVGRTVLWKVVDVNKDGVSDLVHIYHTADSSLAMEWYKYPLADADRRGGSAMADTKGYRYFLFEDVNKNGYVDIVQVYSLYSQLCYVVWDGSINFGCAVAPCPGTCTQYGDSSITWLSGDTDTDTYPDIIQVYDRVDAGASSAQDVHNVCFRVFYGSSSGLMDRGTTTCLAPSPANGFMLDGALYWDVMDVNGDGAVDVVEAYTRDVVSAALYTYSPSMPGDVCLRWFSGNANWAAQTPVCASMMQSSGNWARGGNVNAAGTVEVTQVYQGTDGRTCYTLHQLSPALHWDTCAQGNGPAGALGWLYTDVTGGAGDEQVEVLDTSNGICLGIYAEADDYATATTSCITTSVSATKLFNDQPHIAAGRLAGDSKHEVVVGWQTSSGRSWAVIQTSPSVSTVATFSISGASRPWTMLLTDVNGDGKEDIVEPFVQADGELSVRLITALTPSVVSTVLTSARSPNSGGNTYVFTQGHALAWLSGDFNGDDISDVVQVYNSSGLVCMRLLRGDSELPLAGTDAWCPSQPTDAMKWAAIDVNADGYMDVVQIMNRNLKTCFTWYNWKDRLPRGGCSAAYPSTFPFMPVIFVDQYSVVQPWVLHNTLCYTLFSGESAFLSESSRCLSVGASTLEFGPVTLDSGEFRMLATRNANGRKCTSLAY